MLSNEDRRKVDSYRLLMANVYELTAVSRRDSEAVARQKGVTVTQWHTMSVLSGGDATVPQVAARLGVTRQAVQRTADQLVDSGHVELVTNPRHEKSPLMTLAPRGQAVLNELWDLSDAPRAAMLTAVKQSDLDRACATLGELLVALGGAAGHAGEPA